MITARLHIDIVNNIGEDLPFEVTPQFEAQGKTEDGKPFRTGARYQWCYATRKRAEEIKKRINAAVRDRTGQKSFTWKCKTLTHYQTVENALNSIVNDMREIAA